MFPKEYFSEYQTIGLIRSFFVHDFYLNLMIKSKNSKGILSKILDFQIKMFKIILYFMESIQNLKPVIFLKFFH